MKINVLVPVMFFVGSVLSCGAPEDANTDLAETDITMVSQASKCDNEGGKDKDKKKRCKEKCEHKKGAAKKACRDKCEQSGAGGSGGSSGSGGAGGGIVGQPCTCGGVFDANGVCSVPALVNADCDACGFVTNPCNGQCLTVLPANYGLVCNACGGKTDCFNNCPVCNN